MLNWTPEAEQFRLRLQCAANWLPEYDWPAVDEDSLLASLETRLLPHMSGVHSLRALKALNVGQALRGLLDWSMLQRLDRSASALHFADGKPGLPFAIKRIILRYCSSDAGNVQ